MSLNSLLTATRERERTTTLGYMAMLSASIAMLMLALLAAASALGESLTRAEYVTRLEAICKPRSELTQRAMKGVRADVREGRLPVAARKFERGEKIFGTTIDKIARVPRPPDDLRRLDEWFGYLNRQEDYLGRIAAELRAGREIKAQRLLSRFIHNGNQANNTTLAFEFDHCSFKFSRYGG